MSLSAGLVCNPFADVHLSLGGPVAWSADAPSGMVLEILTLLLSFRCVLVVWDALLYAMWFPQVFPSAS